MNRVIIGVLGFIFVPNLVLADDGQLNDGDWKGSVQYSDGTMRKATYIVTTKDNVTEISLVDETDSKFFFKPVTRQRGKVSFLWSKDDKSSQCTLNQKDNSATFEGECKVFNDLSVVFVIDSTLVPENIEEYAEPENILQKEARKND